MNAIFVKLEQVKVKTITLDKGTPKFNDNGEKVKDENGKVVYSIPPTKEKVSELVSISTKPLDVDKLNTIQGQTEAVTKVMQGIFNTLDYAKQGGSLVVNFGGSTFNLGGKFTLYVNIDGKDYTFLNDVDMTFNGYGTDASGRNEVSFKKLQGFLNQFFAVIRATEGQSNILPNSIKNEILKLNA
jgi:hypothetical protein